MPDTVNAYPNSNSFSFMCLEVPERYKKNVLSNTPVIAEKWKQAT